MMVKQITAAGEDLMKKKHRKNCGSSSPPFAPAAPAGRWSRT